MKPLSQLIFLLLAGLGSLAAQTNTFPNSGNVGIGTMTPGVKLDVAGVTRAQTFAAWGTGQLQLQLINTGDSSDEKITELIQQNGQFVGRFVNDAYTLDDAWLLVRRNPGSHGVKDVLFPSGNFGIGTMNPTYKLTVNGTIRAKEIIVNTGWSDYVFAEDYRLAPLSEVENHIREKKHLPGIPSAAEVEAGGVSLGDMQAKLLAKVEELTLHAIAQAKRIDEQAARLAALERENRALRAHQP